MLWTIRLRRTEVRAVDNAEAVIHRTRLCPQAPQTADPFLPKADHPRSGFAEAFAQLPKTRTPKNGPPPESVSSVGPEPQAAQDPRTPRVAELLRKAIEWQALLESGEAPNQAAIARREGITRAQVTQVMGLLRLAPEIQQHVLSLPDMLRRSAITERASLPIEQTKPATDEKAKF